MYVQQAGEMFIAVQISSVFENTPLKAATYISAF